MPYPKLSLGLCAMLSCGIGVMAALARQLSPEQNQQIEHMTATICTTVQEQKGSASRDQLQADVNAKIGGVVGKIIPLGTSAQGSVSQENYEGLSRDALATALEGDRKCKEDLFLVMFDKFTAEDTGSAAAARAAAAAPATAAPSTPTTSPAFAPTTAPATAGPSAPTTAPAGTAPAGTAPAGTAPAVTGSTECVVNNPSGRPMNVRETPNGAIKDTVGNRARVRPLRVASAADGKPWAYVSDATGRDIGWVFFPYLTCNGPSIR
jgi:hypothetical protein